VAFVVESIDKPGWEPIVDRERGLAASVDDMLPDKLTDIGFFRLKDAEHIWANYTRKQRSQTTVGAPINRLLHVRTQWRRVELTEEEKAAEPWLECIVERKFEGATLNRNFEAILSRDFKESSDPSYQLVKKMIYQEMKEMTAEVLVALHGAIVKKFGNGKPTIKLTFAY